MCARAFHVVCEEEVEESGGEASTTNDVDEVVMSQVHSCPVQHEGISPDVSS